MIGVHTPEFGYEKRRASLEEEVRRNKLAYPQLIDNEQKYWNALDNLYWPTTYLVDKCGRIRERHIGEVHADQESGKRLEASIERLLAEKPDCASAGSGP